MNRLSSKMGWLGLALLGTFAFGYIGLQRGESISAIWIVIAAVCVDLIAYRFYSLYISDKVLGLDVTRMTPAYKYNDGLDYVPTNKNVLFGHHFAAIAGTGPFVGLALKAQMGYLPGMLWTLAGVVFAGAVQYLMVLFISTRPDGRWPLPRRSDQIRAGADSGRDCVAGDVHDHGDYPGGAGADRGQGAGGIAVGHLHGGGDDTNRVVYGRVHALSEAGTDR